MPRTADQHNFYVHTLLHDTHLSHLVQIRLSQALILTHD